MIRAEDYLWNVKAQEQRIREHHDRTIRTLETALQATRELSALDGNPNFQAFVKRLALLHSDAVHRLEHHSGTNDEVRQLQGRCQALRDILDLCTDTHARAVDLARKLQAAQDARDQAVRPDGTVVPPGFSS